jgi:predicted metal-dependent peptidase
MKTANTVENRISKARWQLLRDQPWFGSLAMQLNIVLDESCETANTDGTNLAFGPAFVESLTDDELKTLIAHEVMHCAFLHPYRLKGRDHELFNIACDYAINHELVAAGFKLPAGGLIDAQYQGLSAEAIYEHLAGKSKGPGGYPGRPKSTGDFSEAPDDDGQPSDEPGSDDGQPGQPGSESQPKRNTASDWEKFAEQAAMAAAKAGNMPGGITRALRESHAETVDWRAVLRRFIEQTVPSDYTWSRPNRKLMAAIGLYLPGVQRENMPRLVVAIDTSGSISSELLARFDKEIKAIQAETRPEAIDVIYCDTRINRTDSFGADDEISLTMCGGGGTYFAPVFEHIEQMEQQPAALIYLTDLEAYDDYQEPGYPVLWVTPAWVKLTGEFGETVRMTGD